MFPQCNLVYMPEATHAKFILMYNVIWYIYETQVLWDMTLCCLATSYQDLMKSRYHNLTKHQEPLSQQHCIVSHKTSAFRNTARRTSKPAVMYFVIHWLLSVMFCFIWVIKYVFRPWSSFPDTRHWKIADWLLIFELCMWYRLLQCTLFQGNAVFIYCFSE